MMAIFVVSLGATAFMSITPVTDRAQRLAKEDALATQLCNRFIEQLRLLKPKDRNNTTLTQLNLVDQYSEPYAGTYSFSHIPLDEASKYSPAELLKNGNGSLQIIQLPDNAKELRVTMTWTIASGKSRTLKTGTILGGYR
jgi:hypothetical protein